LGLIPREGRKRLGEDLAGKIGGRLAVACAAVAIAEYGVDVALIEGAKACGSRWA